MVELGDLVIYQVFDSENNKFWDSPRVEIVDREERLDFFNKRGIYKDNNYYKINYVFKKDYIKSSTIEEISLRRN